MASLLLTQLSTNPVILFLLFLLLLLLLLLFLYASATYFPTTLLTYRQLRHIPTIGVSPPGNLWAHHRAQWKYLWNCRALAAEGYRKHPNGLFKLLTWEGWAVAYSSAHVDEVKNAPENVLSTGARTAGRFMARYTGVRYEDGAEVVVRCSRVNLTKAIGQTLEKSVEEVEYALSTIIGGDTESWSELNSYDLTTRLTALLSGLLFLGAPENRSPTWLSFRDHTESLVKAVELLKRTPAFLRPLVQHSALTRVRSYRTAAAQLLEPTIRARLEGSEKGKNDMIQWLLDAENLDLKLKNTAFVAEVMLATSMATINSPAVALQGALHELCLRPEYVVPLREEVERVLAEEGGVFTVRGLARMTRVASFLTEAHRWQGVHTFTMGKTVTAKEGFTFSTGEHVPYGTTLLGVPAAAMAMDPALFENPEGFDGFRFHRLLEETQDKKYLYSSGYPFRFGGGRNACGGRFYVEAQLKLLFASIVRGYEVRAKGGWELVYYEDHVVPGKKEVLEFRRREGI